MLPRLMLVYMAYVLITASGERMRGRHISLKIKTLRIVKVTNAHLKTNNGN